MDLTTLSFLSWITLEQQKEREKEIYELLHSNDNQHEEAPFDPASDLLAMDMLNQFVAAHESENN